MKKALIMLVCLAGAVIAGPPFSPPADAPQPCNYLEESGQYAKLVYQNKTYYAYKANAQPTCENDLFMVLISSGDSPSHYTSIFGEYVRISTTICDLSITSNVQKVFYNFSENQSITLYSSPPGYGYLAISNMSNFSNPISSTGGTIWFNATSEKGIICVGTNCRDTYDGVFYIKYGGVLDLSTCSSYSMTWPVLTSSSSWFWNASIIRRLSPPQIGPFPYSHSDYTGSFKNYRNGTTYRWVVSEKSDFTNSQNNTQSISQILIFPALDYFYYAPNAANPYNAYIVSPSNQLIKPNWIIYLGFGTNYKQPYEHAVFYNRYSFSDYKTTLHGNVATITIDEYGVCYFIPPYTPPNYSLTYTMTAYPISCDANVYYSPSLPLLPTYFFCGQQDAQHYTIMANYSTDVLFERYIYHQDNTSEYTQNFTKSYNEVIPLDNVANITFYVNSRLKCYYSPNSITGLPSFVLPWEFIGFSPFLFIIGFVGFGLTLIHPFAFAFVIPFFELVNIPRTNLLFVAAAASIFAFISNWWGERTLKNIIILFLLANAYLLQLNTYANTSTNVSALNNLLAQIRQLFEIHSALDLIAAITLTIPLLLINLIILLLSLPAIFIGIIFDAFAVLIPNFVSALSLFEGPVIAAAYVWLIIKGYEIGRNMFRQV